MTNLQISGESQVEQRQIISLLVLHFLPPILGYTYLAASPVSDIPSEGNSIWAISLIYVNLACLVLPIILPLLWSRGLCYANISQRVKDRTFNRYLYIAFVPTLCFLVATFLEHKTGILNLHPFYVTGRGTWVDVRSWIIDLLGTLRNIIVLLAIASTDDARWRRGAIAASYIGPLVVQDFFAQLLHIRYKNVEMSLVKLFLPHFASWLEWSTAIVGFFILLTLVEVFRPSLKIACVGLVLAAIYRYVFTMPQHWYYVGYLAFSLLFVLTAWQLKALGRPTHSEDLTVNE